MGIFDGVKMANDPTLKVGDTIICDGSFVEVEKIVRHMPGFHSASPIRNDYWALEAVTSLGSRWHGYVTH